MSSNKRSSAEASDHDGPGGRWAERDPYGQLTPITEDSDDLAYSEDSLFVHDEPDMKLAAVEATRQYLQCMSFGDLDDSTIPEESDAEEERDVPVMYDDVLDDVECFLREQDYL